MRPSLYFKNILLFLNLVTLATYTFMPWQGIAKGSWATCISYWLAFFALFIRMRSLTHQTRKSNFNDV